MLQGSFIILIAVNALTLLVFLLALAQVRLREHVVFDRFQYTTLLIYSVLLVCQIVQACLGLWVIHEYTDARTQILETVQTSLFFLLVDSMWYRLKGLREGDKYLIKQAVYEARYRTYKEMLLFFMGYGLITAMVVLIGYFEHEDGAEFSPFKVFIYLIEFSKVMLDQIMLVLFFRLMSKQLDAFNDLLRREVEDSPAHTLMSSLSSITQVTLACLTIFYEYKLLIRVASSLLYTHLFIERLNEDAQEAANWVFYSLTLLSNAMTMVAGLMFLAFSYIMHRAYTHQSLFGSGLLIDEQGPTVAEEDGDVFDGGTIEDTGLTKQRSHSMNHKINFSNTMRSPDDSQDMIDQQNKVNQMDSSANKRFVQKKKSALLQENRLSAPMLPLISAAAIKKNAQQQQQNAVDPSLKDSLDLRMTTNMNQNQNMFLPSPKTVESQLFFHSQDNKLSAIHRDKGA